MDTNAIIAIADKLIERIEQVYNHFDDPNGIKRALLPAFYELAKQTPDNQQMCYNNRLQFIAQMIDSRKSKNIIDVVNKALPLLSEHSEINAVDEDWLIDFFDKASKCNSDELQTLWARLLAKEADKPGIISKRLLHNLFIMSKKNAEDFVNLSVFFFYDRYAPEVHALVFVKEPLFNIAPLTTDDLKELEMLSLIEINYDGFTIPNRIHLMYMNHYIQLDARPIPAGEVKLTADGKALFSIIEKVNSSTALDGVIEILKNRDVRVAIT